MLNFGIKGDICNKRAVTETTRLVRPISPFVPLIGQGTILDQKKDVAEKRKKSVHCTVSNGGFAKMKKRSVQSQWMASVVVYHQKY